MHSSEFITELYLLILTIIIPPLRCPFVNRNKKSKSGKVLQLRSLNLITWGWETKARAVQKSDKLKIVVAC